MTRANVSYLIHPVRSFESISQIIVCHIHKNTVMGDEHIVNLQSKMAFPPGARLLKIVLQRVEHVPALRQIMVSLCACVQTKELYLILRICMTQRTKCFQGILCYISFSVVSEFEDDFLYLWGWMYFVALVAFSMIICSMLVMIGHVRELKYKYCGRCGLGLFGSL